MIYLFWFPFYSNRLLNSSLQKKVTAMVCEMLLNKTWSIAIWTRKRVTLGVKAATSPLPWCTSNFSRALPKARRTLTKKVQNTLERTLVDTTFRPRSDLLSDMANSRQMMKWLWETLLALLDRWLFRWTLRAALSYSTGEGVWAIVNLILTFNLTALEFTMTLIVGPDTITLRWSTDTEVSN